METNKTRSITSFISSANRQAHEQVYDFSIDYPDGILVCNADEYMELNVLSFDMPNTMYNINENNNVFEFITDGVVVSKTIPAGNYSVKTFMVQLSSLINNTDISIKYNEAQNTYTFTKKGTSQSIYKIKPITIGNLIGVGNNIEYEITTVTTSGFKTGLINLVNYNKVIVETENLNYYYSNMHNLHGNEGSKQLFSNIIFWKSKADVEPFQVLKYNNEDGGNSFVYKVMNKQINSISFRLKNEKEQILTDAPDYLMVIQFNFYQKKERDVHSILLSLDTTIKEIYNTILFALNRLRLLL
jgi:hypothetical protein